MKSARRRSTRLAVVLGATLIFAGCGDDPVSPTTGAVSSIDNEQIVGQMAVAFLNRFVASNVSPAACLVDFTDACRGKSEELSDITFNRSHFRILGARIGNPTVRLASSGASADISIPCAFDSRTIKCEPGDTCSVGAIGYVAGTCLLTSVREPTGWRLCTSNFSGSVVTSSAQTFFGANN